MSELRFEERYFPFPPLVAKIGKMGKATKKGKSPPAPRATRISALPLVLCALASPVPATAASSLSQTRVRASDLQNQAHAEGEAELTLRRHKGKVEVYATIRIKCKQRFTGEQYDPETGMYYLRARYYDPEIGRFITRDTWPGDPNRFVIILRSVQIDHLQHDQVIIKADDRIQDAYHRQPDQVRLDRWAYPWRQ